MNRYLISLGLSACALTVMGCSYNNGCASGGCGTTTAYVPTTTYVAKTTYVPTTKYVATTTYTPTISYPVVNNNCCPTCSRCGNGYDYGYSSYNTGWY